MTKSISELRDPIATRLSSAEKLAAEYADLLAGNLIQRTALSLRSSGLGFSEADDIAEGLRKHLESVMHGYEDLASRLRMLNVMLDRTSNASAAAKAKRDRARSGSFTIN